MRKNRFVIIRDDDVNALTPVSCLKMLYQPFLEKGLPINLAVIPLVNTQATTKTGDCEEFLLYKDVFAKDMQLSQYVPIGQNQELVKYLHDYPGYCIVQHGCHHDYCEFNTKDRHLIQQLLQDGRQALQDAGFLELSAFVAPHDAMTKISLYEVSRTFSVISKNEYSCNQVPFSMLPSYVLWKHWYGSSHWKEGNRFFLARPKKTFLSSQVSLDEMLQGLIGEIESRTTTVIHTHWWSFYKNPKITDRFVQILHQLAEYIDSNPFIHAVSFKEVLEGKIPLQ